ncbi:hypothetical protein CROQUDRAFT_86044 [Cronartium quercuum f. sp. fusiforme G11]|uniref:DUF7872 domain-containing protein n=1 Tax=Cronartium quercuum f. sp. fusiforme G11 TaxID=708437 RepID=A0A9P6TIJ3_9BASI|nr:hypothetical protein CROQUDRAFT_86044 [Cronartium quercuum f. sp. fusiforme G11]
MRPTTLVFNFLTTIFWISWINAHDLQKRQTGGFESLFGGGGGGGGLGGGGDKAQPQGPPSNPSAPVNDSCKALPFTKETWDKLSLDHYLKTYPGGANISVSAYAASKKAPNFECGVTKRCHAGQLCQPVMSPDWYILFAIQQWNAHVNGLVEAVSFGVNFVQATISLLLASLFPAVDVSTLEHFKLDMSVNGAFMMVSNTVLIDIMALFNSFQGFGGNLINIISNIITAGFEFGGGLIRFPAGPERDAFTFWSHLADSMAAYEKHIIDTFTETIATTLEKGISTDEGIYGAISNGTYIKPEQSIFLPLLADDIKNVTSVLALVQILRGMDSFVAIGTDVCNGRGKNGALEGRDVLSYCDPEGTVSKDDKEERTFQNAYVIEEQFGYTTQFLTNASLSCQNKYGGFGHTPNNTINLPLDPTSDCVVNLPVCDCRDKGTSSPPSR